MRKVLVFCGNRAEFGLFQLIIRRLRSDARLSARMAVSGALADARWGDFRKQALEGNTVDHILEVPTRALDEAGVCSVIAELIGQVGALIRSERPDLLLVLGDRSETLAAVLAAHYHSLLIAHIHGGDRVLTDCHDTNVRHAISKLAHLHFTACADSALRLERMGEDPARIILSGSPASEIARRVELFDTQETRARLDLGDDEPFLLVTVHPENADPVTNVSYQAGVLAALERLGMTAVITYPNNDPGGDAMIAALHHARLACRVVLRDSLGVRLYLSALRDCRAVVGNSSSGIIEAGIFHTPAVDLGWRQRGRFCGANVVRCESYQPEVVSAALTRALSPAFRAAAAAAPNPYDLGDTSAIICDTLAAVPFTKDLFQKPITY